MNSLKSTIRKAKIPYDQFRKKKKEKKLSKPIGGGKRKKTRRRRRKKTRRRRRRRKTRRRRHRRRRTGKRMQGGGILNPQVGDIVYNNRANVRGTIIAIRLEGGGGGGGVAGGGGRGRMKIRVNWNGGLRTGFEYADKPNFVRSNTTGGAGAGAAADAMQYRRGGAAQNRPIHFLIEAHSNEHSIGTINTSEFPRLVAISFAAKHGEIAHGGASSRAQICMHPEIGREHLGGVAQLPLELDDVILTCHCCQHMDETERKSHVAWIGGRDDAECYYFREPDWRGAIRREAGTCKSTPCDSKLCTNVPSGQKQCDKMGIFIINIEDQAQIPILPFAGKSDITFKKALHWIRAYMDKNYPGGKDWTVFGNWCRGSQQSPAAAADNKNLDNLLAELYRISARLQELNKNHNGEGDEANDLNKQFDDVEALLKTLL